MIEQIDTEMVARLRAASEQADTPWLGLLAEGVAYIEMALEPEIRSSPAHPAASAPPSRGGSGLMALP